LSSQWNSDGQADKNGEVANMRQKLETPSRVPCMPAKHAVPGIAVLLLGWAAGPLLAQDTVDPAPLPKSGLQIRSISAYGVYYSKGLPFGIGTIQPGVANAPSDVGAGGNIVIDWTKFTERSTFSLTYSPSYAGQFRYSSLNAFNHALSLNASGALVSHWRYHFAAACDFSNLGEYMFSASALSNAASVPANFEDLAAALLSSKFANNPQLGVILTGSPLVESPVRALVYGQRMLTASAQAKLSYSFSPRLSVSFSGGGARTQHVSDSQTSGSSNFYLLPTTTSGSAGLEISYSLSPVTQVGGSLTTTRVSSSLQDFYTTSSVGTWGRVLSRRWLIQLYGGLGVADFLGRSSYAPSKSHPIAGGSLTYKTAAHTFLASYARTTNDTYGLRASTTASADAAWKWGRRGMPWWIESSFGWQQFYGNGVSNISGWRATAGWNRRLAPHFVLLTQYAYLSYGGAFQAAGSRFSQHAARIAITWISKPISLQ
jgi:hypothetical protein